MFVKTTSAVCRLIATLKEGACGVCGFNSRRFNQHTINTYRPSGYLQGTDNSLATAAGLFMPINTRILLIFIKLQSAELIKGPGWATRGALMRHTKQGPDLVIY